MPAVTDLPEFVNFELPQFDVITPHTKLTIPVRSLLVEQEEVLKTSAVSDKRILEIINRVVYECIVEKKPPYDTFENFMKHLTTADRDALLYGLVLVSYEVDQEYEVRCPVCGYNYNVKVDLREVADIHIYQGKENLVKKRVKVELPISKYIVYLKAPTVFDEYSFAMSQNISLDVIKRANEYIIIDKLEIPTKDGKFYTTNNLLEIYTTVRKLGSRDRKLLTTQWNEHFGKYYVRGKKEVTCPRCDSTNNIIIHPLTELFRLLF